MATQPRAPHEAEVRDLALVIEAARKAVEQEWAIAERLESKARNLASFAFTWFGIVSAIAALAMKELLDADSYGLLFSFIVVLAGGAALLLALLLLASDRVWRLRRHSEITEKGLEQMLYDARDPDVDIAERLVGQYRHVLGNRRRANKERGNAFRTAQKLWVASLIVASAELVVALAAIAQS